MDLVSQINFYTLLLVLTVKLVVVNITLFTAYQHTYQLEINTNARIHTER